MNYRKDSRAPKILTPARVKWPCQKCSTRYVGCHAECERYKEVKEKSISEFYDKIDAYRRDRIVDNYVSDEKRKNVLNHQAPISVRIRKEK